MNSSVRHRIRISIQLPLALSVFAAVAFAQKAPAPPPAPPPPPTSGAPGSSSTNPPFGTTQLGQQRDDYVKFLLGRVTIGDGTPLPTDILIERVCNTGIRQQVHASPNGEFSMELGSKMDTTLDATAEDPSQRTLNNQNAEEGIQRRALSDCELRASVSGFSSSVINLVDLHDSLSTVDVGAITLHRRNKIAGATLSASAYLAPKDAQKAYDKGLQAQKKGSLADAQKYFSKAVALYPKYTNAWFQLGTVLQKQQQKDAALEAFTKATTLDSRFLPPYLYLSRMTYQAGNWTDLLAYTDHILDLDPLNKLSGYVWDLDSLNYTEAYFYNAVANFKLNRFDAAEKIGLKAARVDLPTRFPQLHILLADIFTRKNDYSAAIIELQNYLDLVPNAKDAGQIRERLTKLQKLNTSASLTTNSPEN